MRPSQLVEQRPETENPFSLIPQFICLDEVLNTKGKTLPDVIDIVSEHMSRNNIVSATINCSGATGRSVKHFVNLPVIKDQLPEEFKDVTTLHHLVHLESKNYQGVVVLKSAAVQRSSN